MRWRVGNDVVDLEDPEAIDAHLRDRFVQRVLASDERERLAVDPEPLTRLWSYFAAKEAAYKVAVKLRPATILAHRRFRVAEDFSHVRFEELRLRLRIIRGDGYVHAIAAEAGEPRGGVARLEGDDPSAEVRRRLCAEVAAVHGLDPGALRVIRDPSDRRWDGKGPPRLELQGRPLPLDVSLSHHGRWVAWVFS